MEPLDRKTEIAVANFDRDIAINPEDQSAFLNMGLWWHWKGEYAKALEHYDGSIRLSPRFAYALSARASLRATCPDADWRNGVAAVNDATESLRFATAAQEMDGSWKERQYLQILAAAHAECGNFTEAIRWQTAALQLAITKAATQEIRTRLAVYEAGRPIREDKGLVRIGVSDAGR